LRGGPPGGFVEVAVDFNGLVDAIGRVLFDALGWPGEGGAACRGWLACESEAVAVCWVVHI